MTEEPEQFEEIEQIPEEIEQIPEEQIPEKKSLKDRVICPDCGRQVSAHCLKFTHRCRKKKEEEKEKPEKPEKEKPEKKVKIKAIPDSVAEQPMKNKKIIKKAEVFIEDMQPPPPPPQPDYWAQIMMQRQAQARMRSTHRRFQRRGWHEPAPKESRIDPPPACSGAVVCSKPYD